MLSVSTFSFTRERKKREKEKGGKRKRVKRYPAFFSVAGWEAGYDGAVVPVLHPVADDASYLFHPSLKLHCTSRPIVN